MPGNEIGQIYRVTTFGESHGPAIGVVIDGCPSGLPLDPEYIQSELNRRKPGQSRITSPRQESDRVEFISGLFKGQTTGAPLCALIHNRDARSEDYSHLENYYRPSHADYTYDMKYKIRDHRGGGRSSARETAARVIAGAVAKIFLRRFGIQVHAFVSQVGKVRLDLPLEKLDLSFIEQNLVRCPDPATAEQMIQMIDRVRDQGDTVGGVITGLIRGCPVGLGEPVFDRLHADLGKAMLSINAVKGFDYGSGFAGSELLGSEHNDAFILPKNPEAESSQSSEFSKSPKSKETLQTATNHSGGIQGGISNGMDIYFRVAFKPVATLLNSLPPNPLGERKGRHDPCVVPRAVPIVEAMAAITLMDHFLRSRHTSILDIEK